MNAPLIPQANPGAAFRSRRCIVPANGFYEWQPLGDRQGGGKQPFYIHPVGGEFFALAGLWERWTRPGDGEEIDTFTIVTTEANAAMRPLHDRMPVILAPGERITAEILDYIEYAKAKGCSMTGPEDPDILRLNVLA